MGHFVASKIRKKIKFQNKDIFLNNFKYRAFCQILKKKNNNNRRRRRRRRAKAHFDPNSASKIRKLTQQSTALRQNASEQGQLLVYNGTHAKCKDNQ